MKRAAFKGRMREAGSVAIEFALLAIIFFTVVFATMEFARFEYLLNTLHEVTRRAAAGAAHTDYTNDAAMKTVQANAVFRDSAGPLGLGAPVMSSHVKIDYLSVSEADWDLTHVSNPAACPAGNRLNCMSNPHANNCIRFVRARVCASMDAAGNCEQLPYQMVFPFLNLSGIKLPSAETIVPAGSLGATLGSMPCT